MKKLKLISKISFRLILVFFFIVAKNFAQSWQMLGSPLYSCYDLVKCSNSLYAASSGGAYRLNNNGTWVSLPSLYAISYPVTIENFNDTIYTAGCFPYGNGPQTVIYRFYSNAWHAVGGYVDEPYGACVRKLKNFNGKLIAGGSFSTIGGYSIKNIAVWNGVKWDTMAKSLNGGVNEMSVFNGSLIVSGAFQKSGNDSTIKFLATWNGSNWSPLTPTYTFKSPVGKTIPFQNKLIIANIWDTINSIPMRGIASWDGTSFTSMGNVLIGGVGDLSIFNGDLYCTAGLNTLNPNDPENVVLKWNGYFWQKVGGDFNNYLAALDDYNGELIAGGFFGACDSVFTGGVARYNDPNGIHAYSLGSSIDIYPNPANDLVFIKGDFTTASSVQILNSFGELEKVISYDQLKSGRGIDVADLRPGLYVLNIQEKNGNRIQNKIIISNF